ncbi:MAG: hypothetical protein ACLTXL_06425 [Clostridia bacterium]
MEIGTFSTKAVSGVSGLSKLLLIFLPIGLATTAAGILTAGLVGIGVWAKPTTIWWRPILRNFGDIEFAEEVEDVAKRPTHQDWMVTLDASIKAKEKLTEFQENLEETVAELNKTEWKVGVGLELTEEEKRPTKIP